MRPAPHRELAAHPGTADIPTPRQDPAAGPGAGTPPPTDVLAEAGALLASPGLVVLTAGPGCGRSTALRQLGAAFRGPVFAGGGLAMLRTTPAFALTRAVRVRLPGHDPALLAEAVRSRVRAGLLLLDDLQWADPATLAALPPLAAHCRIAVALRTPHRLPPGAQQTLRAAATGWLTLPPLDTTTITDLVHRTAPGLAPAAVAEVVRRAGGVPLTAQVLARHALTSSQRHPTGAPPATTGPAATHVAAAAAAHPAAAPDGPGQLAYAVAQALADLPRPARTAMAALGLLGRPATAAVLGPAVAELTAAGLVTTTPDPTAEATGTPAPTDPATAQVTPVSPYLAEVAAGLLDPPARQALHRRLATLVPPAEAARHLAAAGDTDAAYTRAVRAAADAPSTGQRAELLLLACQLPGARPPPTVRIDAARAALACGHARAAVSVLTASAVPAGFPPGAGPAGTAQNTQPPAFLLGIEAAGFGLDAQAAVLHAEALLQLGELAQARHAAAQIPDDAPAPVLAGRDRVLLLTRLADRSTGDSPAGSGGPADDLDQIIARHGPRPAHLGLRAALAAVHAAHRTPGWEHALASAAATAGAAGDELTARWSAWLLVETLAGDGRLAEAARTAASAAAACAADLAYSWQTRFLAAQLWCTALHGTAQPTRDQPTTDDSGGGDEVLRRAAELTDRTLPAQARGYATAAVGLLEADSGLLATARTRLAAAGRPTGTGTGTVAVLLDWVTREAAWLDNQPGQAGTTPPPPSGTSPLLDGLHQITARWAAHDTTAAPGAAAIDPPTTGPPAVRETLAAWAGQPDRFAAAAAAWHDLAAREQVRCLLAQGLHTTDPAQAVPPLLAAEQLAQAHGLVVLLGRIHRALRRHAIRRDNRGRRAGRELTGRERDVLRLVARGEPTRRIAGQLGISRETVETHIRAGMRKLGAHTRTEAAALALEVIT